MIAYDFDGVLVTDYSHIEGLSDDEFFEFVGASHPLFEPPGDYVVITARSSDREPQTAAVLMKLSNQPVAVYFREDQSQDPGEYKAQVLRGLPEVKTFVESSQSQAETISKNWTGTVVHFGSWISRNLITVALTR